MTTVRNYTSGYGIAATTAMIDVVAVIRVDVNGLTVARTWEQIRRDREPREMRAG